jgi:hypothetical protein
MAFDDLTLESFISDNTMRAADAVAPNLPYPPQARLPEGIFRLWHARSVAAVGAALRDPAAMQIADHSGVFFVCLTAPPQDFLEGSTSGESTVC